MIYSGDALAVLKQLDSESVQCCVTSPPYFQLRDYGVDGQIGLEDTPEEFIAKLVEVFHEVKRVLKPDGTLWVNIADSYAGSGKGRNADGRHSDAGGKNTKQSTNTGSVMGRLKKTVTSEDAKPKDLLGIPWMLAFALRADGWYLRSDIVWCISGGAMVYAKIKSGAEEPVMMKDLARMNPADVMLWNGEKWTQALGWNKSTDTGEKLELVLRSGERIGCTENHVWPTERGNVKAKDLAVGDVIKMCRLPEPENPQQPSYLTDDLLWLIGLYIAEGSRSGKTLQLSLNEDELPWVERIHRAVSSVGGKTTHFIYGHNLAVHMTGKVLTAIIDEYVSGSDSYSVRFSPSVWRLPNRAIHKIVEGYLDGDGHKDPHNDRWRIGFCRNYDLEKSLRTAAARLGATLTLNLATSKCLGKTYPTFKGEWRWRCSEHKNVKNRGEVVEIRKSRAREFWDVAVADEPHLFALASGVLTHNCKPNVIPESVKDRPTRSHEHVFLLSKSRTYYYDYEAVMEDAVGYNNAEVAGSEGTLRPNTRRRRGNAKSFRGGGAYTNNRSYDNSAVVERETHGNIENRTGKRNRRDVWSVATQGTRKAHFATFPEKLIEPCILAGTKAGDIVLDPFAGSGTTGIVAHRYGREFIGIELNEEYAELARRRVGDVQMRLAL